MLINKCQNNVNINYNPAFAAANFRFANGEAKKFGEYMQSAPNDFGVIPYFKDNKGQFNMSKVARQLREAFNDPFYSGTYVFKGFRKNKEGIVKAKLIHLDEEGKEIKGDVFQFNPTFLFKKSRENAKELDTIDVLNDQLTNELISRRKELMQKYGKNAWQG